MAIISKLITIASGASLRGLANNGYNTINLGGDVVDSGNKTHSGEFNKINLGGDVVDSGNKTHSGEYNKINLGGDAVDSGNKTHSGDFQVDIFQTGELKGDVVETEDGAYQPPKKTKCLRTDSDKPAKEAPATTEVPKTTEALATTEALTTTISDEYEFGSKTKYVYDEATGLWVEDSKVEWDSRLDAEAP